MSERWADLPRCPYCNEKGVHAPQCDRPSLPAERDEPVTAAGRRLAEDYAIKPVGGDLLTWEERNALILAIEHEAATPSAETLAVLDNLLRHHNTLHSSDCEFARAALAHLSPPTDTGAER